PAESSLQLRLATLCQAYGFLGHARTFLLRALASKPTELGVLANLANVARDKGDHVEARQLYERLLARLPDHPVVRRNYLVGLEYDPTTDDAYRLAAAQAWGRWAVNRTGECAPRPHGLSREGSPLRVGYVGADFCQHTVGLFVKDMLAAHDPARVQVFVYSAGAQNDWVTQLVRATG